MRPHIRFCLYIFVSTLPTYPFFHAFNNHFLQPTLPFLPTTFFNQFSQLLRFFSSNHLPPHFHSQFSQTILFFATISSASNHLNQFLFPIQPFHWVSLPSPPPPLQFFLARLSISFVFTEKSWGEPCRGIELSIPRICVAHV